MLISFTLNGQETVADVDPERGLLSYLRDERGLVGAKNGCGKGHCGACTVIIDGRARWACTTRMKGVAGRSVETIENLSAGNFPDVLLHPLQYAFLEADAVQCGFCTPGMVMSARALLAQNPHPSEEEVRKALAGNLCRCTGYQKIVRAVMAAAKKDI